MRQDNSHVGWNEAVVEVVKHLFVPVDEIAVGIFMTVDGVNFKGLPMEHLRTKHVNCCSDDVSPNQGNFKQEPELKFRL